jgi:O-antigen/teichoic acid export membrane protein
VAESLYFLPVVLANTFLPRIGRGTGRFASDPVLRQLYQSSWLLGVGMALTSMLLLPPLLPLVFGDEFLPAQAALVWLGPAAFAVAIGCSTGAWLNVNNHYSIIWKRTTLGAVVNVILNLILIHPFGFVGAAIATSASQLIAANIVQLFDQDTRQNQLSAIFPFKRLRFSD